MSKSQLFFVPNSDVGYKEYFLIKILHDKITARNKNIHIFLLILND